MNNKEYTRKLKAMQSKVFELVYEDIGRISNNEEASALGWAIKLIRTLTINNDNTIGGGYFLENNSNAKWVATHSIEKALQKLGGRYGNKK